MLPRSILLALACSLVAWAAHAQSPEDKAAAESLFEAGKTSLERGDLASACRQFEASLRLDAGVGTLLYLADCYQASGRTASAWAMFKEASSLARERGQPDRAELGRARAEALKPNLSTLTVVCRTPCAQDLRAERDGAVVPRSSFGVAVPVDPGTHVVYVTRPGYVPLRTGVYVAPGGAKAKLVVSELRALSAPMELERSSRAAGTRAVRGRGTEHARGRGRRTVAAAMGTFGLAALAASAVFGLRARLLNERSLDHCQPANQTLCSDRGVALRADAFASARLSTASVVAGVGLVATAGVLWLTAPSGSSPRVRMALPLEGARRATGQGTP